MPTSWTDEIRLTMGTRPHHGVAADARCIPDLMVIASRAICAR